MGSTEPRDERCGAKLRSTDDGETLYCENWPCNCDKDRCSGQECGRCRLHGAHNTGREGIKDAAYKHGLTASWDTYYDHQDSADQDMIDEIRDTMLARADFTEEDYDLYLRLKTLAVDIHKRLRIQGEIGNDGVVKEQVVGVSDQGEPIWREDEHYLHKTYSRLRKDIQKEMEDLGVMPETDESDAAETFASMIKELADA